MRQSGSSSGERDPSMTSMRRSGLSVASAAGEPAAERSAAAEAESGMGALDERSVGSISWEEDSKGEHRDGPKGTNPWNHFQHAHKGKGLNSTSMAQMYHQRRSEQREGPN